MSNASISHNSNMRRTVMIASAVVIGMVGMSFAAVPAYRIFCEVTGYGGTTQRTGASALPSEAAVQALAGQTVKVRFDGNVRGDLPWTFKPSSGPMEVKIGEQNLAYFTATSNASVPTTGSATFNVTPKTTGLYFAKMQCFCFTEQTLQPGETVEMPVVFFVAPEILDDINTRDVKEITLSYSFYPVNHPKVAPGIYANGNANVEAIRHGQTAS